MKKFIACKSKKEFCEIAGHDWEKIVKVCGGYIGFETLDDYKVWMAQK